MTAQSVVALEMMSGKYTRCLNQRCVNRLDFVSKPEQNPISGGSTSAINRNSLIQAIPSLIMFRMASFRADFDLI